MKEGKIRNEVLLVDHNDKPLGVMDKLEAHQKGLLHRAFSVFVFNSKNQLLLQQRATTKYHGAGLWTNTCCSHPLMDEEVLDAAHERLSYEMGITCSLSLLYRFVYNEKVENNLTEHEFDYVYVGSSNDAPSPNADEVNDYKWIDIGELFEIIEAHPDKFTVWFKMALPKVVDKLRKQITEAE